MFHTSSSVFYQHPMRNGLSRREHRSAFTWLVPLASIPSQPLVQRSWAPASINAAPRRPAARVGCVTIKMWRHAQRHCDRRLKNVWISIVCHLRAEDRMLSATEIYIPTLLELSERQLVPCGLGILVCFSFEIVTFFRVPDFINCQTRNANKHMKPPHTKQKTLSWSNQVNFPAYLKYIVQVISMF